MKEMSVQRLIATDKKHIWHPYASMVDPPPVLPVASASGVRLKLTDGRTLVDGMASWWAAIHGYGHPVLNDAILQQTGKMAHVMFGGLTHHPAVELTEMLMDITPESLDTVFYSDSGSVAVEVAIKMALQYWASHGFDNKRSLLTIRGGYHGDTFGAMAVCDPVTGMHHLFNGVLPKHLFSPVPTCRFGAQWHDGDMEAIQEMLVENHRRIAAVILEPVMQGAGGMRFYHPDYLKQIRALCDQYGVLLIFDEIATGFGRTGKLFASEHAGVSPDIMCVGKALTGGYMSLAATLASRRVSDGISRSGEGVFMHGPTFMANPLACAVALTSIRLLLKSPWEKLVETISMQMRTELSPAKDLPQVADVRTLGAVGVVELRCPVNMRQITSHFVDRGVWIRPFGRLIYIMPPYIIGNEDLSLLTNAILSAAADESCMDI